MRLEFHPDAEWELIEAAVHYELEVPGLGERFESEVDVWRNSSLSIPKSVNRLIPFCAGWSFPVFPSR